MSDSKPVTITVAQWPVIADDVKNELCVAYIYREGNRKVLLFGIQPDGKFYGADITGDIRTPSYFRLFDSCAYLPDTIITVEWIEQPATVETAGVWPLGELYLAMRNDPGNLKKQVAYYKALAEARLNDYYAKADEVIALKQQLEAERSE